MKFKKRMPALSEQQEMKRVSRYWKYLDAKSSNIIDSSLDLGLDGISCVMKTMLIMKPGI